MSYSVQNAKDDLSGRLHGTTVNKVRNIDSVFRRAANSLLGKIDPAETKITTQISLYDNVFDYAAPSDLKEKKIYDIRPQGSRDDSDNINQKFSKDFDRGKEKKLSWVSVENNNGVKFLRISKRFSPSAASFDDLNDDSGWAAGGNASNLLEEDLIFDKGGLQIDLALAGTSGYIESSSINSADFSEIENKSAVFLEVYIPTAAILATITNFILRWGNSSTVYFSKTITTAHLGSFKVGKNLLRFDWNGATETGSVDSSAIDYARITVTYTGAVASPGIIFSNIFFSVARIHDLDYYSKYLFSTSGTWGDEIGSDDTLINLDTPTYNIFIDELTLEASQQVQGEAAASDRAEMKSRLYGEDGESGSYSNYKENNPSEALKPQSKAFSVRGFRRK